MSNEFSRVEMRFPPDALGVAGAVAAAEHFGQRVNLEDTAVTALAEATEEACKSTFKLLVPESPELGVIIEEFADRVEVHIEHRGEALPTAGLDTFLFAGSEEDSSEDLSGLALLSLVDRVQYQTVAGTQRMSLVKYIHRAPDVN